MSEVRRRFGELWVQGDPAADHRMMGLVLPISLVVLVFASVALARRPTRPPLPLVVAVQVLTLVVGFGFGFSLAAVESSYLRAGLAGLVEATASVFADDEASGCERVRRAYVDGVDAIEDGAEGVGLQSRVLRSLEQSSDEAVPGS